MYEPMQGSATFHRVYGPDPLDLSDRVGAVSLATQLTAALDEVAQARSTTLCALVADLESGASDEVLLTGFERAGVALAQELVALYDAALMLGVERINDLMARVQGARMAGRGRYVPPSAVGLVKLPQ